MHLQHLQKPPDAAPVFSEGVVPVLSEAHGRINPCSDNAASWFRSVMPSLVRAADVLFPVAGVASRQAAQRHRSRHEASLRVRFAGRH